MSFGLAYLAWGLRRAEECASLARPSPHERTRPRPWAQARGEHVHVHDGGATRMTPWVIFVIFVLGPCEPIIPVVVYPAVKELFNPGCCDGHFRRGNHHIHARRRPRSLWVQDENIA